MIDKTLISSWFESLQDDICHQLEKGDGTAQFKEDNWERPGGGGGKSRVIEGEYIEKGGVNFSAVQGALPPKIAKALNSKATDFYASGLSIVLHPRNPWVPIIHMNVRYFELAGSDWWFGGGIDLTPHYINVNEAKQFHQQLKSICDLHQADYYDRFRSWADRYFYLPHRSERRGVGGIFFDRLGEAEPLNKSQLFEFVKSVGNAFCPAWIPVLEQNKTKAFTSREEQWQRLRRGRYVEFNLVWDKGTKFGLDTDGRTESILMSLPPLAAWEYNHAPERDSQEALTQEYLRQDIDWLKM